MINVDLSVADFLWRRQGLFYRTRVQIVTPLWWQGNPKGQVAAIRPLLRVQARFACAAVPSVHVTNG